jgi:hypothetical protein
MKEVVKQTLIAAAAATTMMLALGKPKIIAQLVVFIPTFAVTFGVLYLLSRKKL